jgi:hypothetical protein
MNELTLIGWRAGLKTVSLIELVRKSHVKSLTEAKSMVDNLLSGKTIILHFDSPATRDAFRSNAEGLGVIFATG